VVEKAEAVSSSVEDGYDVDTFSTSSSDSSSRSSSSSSSSSSTTVSPPLVQDINSIDEYWDFVGAQDTDGDDDQLTVVKFYASWCKSCAKFDLKYRKLARKENQRVRFAQCEFVANRNMCTSLGVTKFPHIHVYKGKAGKVDDFLCGPKRFQKLVDTVEEYADATVEEIRLKQTLKEGDSLIKDERIEFTEEHIINVFV